MNSLPLAIYYASETGNAESVAYEIYERARAQGWPEATLDSIAALTPEKLSNHRLAIFAVSTWGVGDPPSEATDFYYELESAEIDLSGLNYAVFGLGDSDYPDFNAFAGSLDTQLSSRGAHRLLERAEADVEFDELYEEWADKLFSILPKTAATAESTAVAATP